ncbi:hypothetical protein ACIA49_38875 [Kribbella sp. NPDC051587]|uniref:hypothetical protein n=1 Tax=Kribbella sp. NPDC051587 TaxID=3364119 RepID=UPI0037B1C869
MFDSPLGTYSVAVAPESIWIHQGMGTHYLQLQLDIGVPEVGTEAGRLLCLETTLSAPRGSSGSTVPLAQVNVSVPFSPDGGLQRVSPQYFLTNAQLLAVEQHRTDDLRLELRIRAYLPQAAGYPGCAEVVEPVVVADSRWRKQLKGLGRTLGVDMVIPFPAGDGPRQAVADLLRDAQRMLGGNDVDGAMLRIRRALEEIKQIAGWTPPPGSSNRNDRAATAEQRWAGIRAALEHQASGAMHGDGGTKGYVYSRAEAEALIGLTAALLTIVP